jgi:hypothetical protein
MLIWIYLNYHCETHTSGNQRLSVGNMAHWSFKKFENDSMATGVTWSSGCKCVVVSGYDGKLKWFDVSGEGTNGAALHAQLTGDERSNNPYRPAGQAYVEREAYNNGYGGNGYNDAPDVTVSSCLTSEGPATHFSSNGMTVSPSSSQMCRHCNLPIRQSSVFDVAFPGTGLVTTEGKHQRFNQKGSVVVPDMNPNMYKEQRKILREEARRISDNLYDIYWKDPFYKDQVRKLVEANGKAQEAVDLLEVQRLLQIIHETETEINDRKRSKYEVMGVLLDNGPQLEVDQEDHMYELVINCEGKLHIEKRWAEELSTTGNYATTRFRVGQVDPFEMHTIGGRVPQNDRMIWDRMEQSPASVQVVMTGVRGATKVAKLSTASHLRGKKIDAARYKQEITESREKILEMLRERLQEQSSLKNRQIRELLSLNAPQDEIDDVEKAFKKAEEGMEAMMQRVSDEAKVGIVQADLACKDGREQYDSFPFEVSRAQTSAEILKEQCEDEVFEKGWRDADYEWASTKTDISMTIRVTRHRIQTNRHLDLASASAEFDALEVKSRQCFEARTDLEAFKMIKQQVNHVESRVMDKILDFNKALNKARTFAWLLLQTRALVTETG